MSFYSKMKENRKKGANKLREKANQQSQGGGYADDPNVWKLQRDKSDNGFAIIRFLPASEKDFEYQSAIAEKDNIDLQPGDVLPWSLVYSHGFKVKGRWFIHDCPRTIGNECPVCDIEKQKIDDGIGWEKNDREHPDRKIYGQRKGKKKYWSNIYVVKDTANPENEGKVKLFAYGGKIHEKLIRAMNPPPEFDDEEPMNPFDPWDGADFKLKALRKDGYINYDSSGFTDTCMLADEDEEIEEILSKMFFLGELLDPKRFKDYDKLAKDYERVVNSGNAPRRQSIEEKEGDGDSGGDVRVDDAPPQGDPLPNKKVRRKRSEMNDDTAGPAKQKGRVQERPEPEQDTAEQSPDDDGDGDGVEYFRSLLDED